MEAARRILIIIVAGGVLGALSYFYLNGWYNVIPWAIASVFIGYKSSTMRSALIGGAVFGYVLFLVYTYVGYNGKNDLHGYIRFVLIDLGLSFIGAIVGVAGCFAGFYLKPSEP